jgi:hypothetical protein
VNFQNVEFIRLSNKINLTQDRKPCQAPCRYCNRLQVLTRVQINLARVYIRYKLLALFCSRAARLYFAYIHADWICALMRQIVLGVCG